MPKAMREVAMFPICLREFEVLKSYDVTPGMQRIILGGPALTEHTYRGQLIPQIQSPGFDDHVKILLPDPVTGELKLPEQNDNGTLAWSREILNQSRVYTIRYLDQEKGELAIDFAKHVTGLASTWAKRAQVGDKLHIAGPPHSDGIPENVDWMLIAGDETALPAIGRCLEMLPETMRAQVVIQVAKPEDRQELTSAAQVEITWLYRHQAVPEVNDLVETIQNLPWWDGQVYVWVAGETLTIKPLRRWFRGEKGLEKDAVEITGYWRSAKVAASATDPEVPDLSVAPDSRLDNFCRQIEILPAFAVRSAVTWGLFSLIAEGKNTAAALAEATSTSENAIKKLLRYLVSMGLLEVNTDRTEYSLTELSQEIDLDDRESYWSEELNFNKAPTRKDLAFINLTDALRSGSPVKIGPQGEAFSEIQNTDRTLQAQIIAEAGEMAEYLTPNLIKNLGLDRVKTLACVGAAAGAFANRLLRRLPQLEILLIGLPSVLELQLRTVDPDLRGRVRVLEQSIFEVVSPQVEMLLMFDVINKMKDADAELLLQKVTQSAEVVLEITEILDENRLEEHETEDDLQRLCLYGSGLRTRTEYEELVSAAEVSLEAITPVIWYTYALQFRGKS